MVFSLSFAREGGQSASAPFSEGLQSIDKRELIRKFKMRLPSKTHLYQGAATGILLTWKKNVVGLSALMDTKQMLYTHHKKTHANTLHSLGLTGPNADVDVKDNYGETPLIKAAAKGNLFVVKRLLALGADVHAQGKNSNSALEEASDRGHAGIVRLLIAHGAKVNPKNTNGYTPLMAAAEWGHASAMKVLLRKGAAVNAMDDFGRTALNTAAIDHWHTIPLLLRWGADIHAGNDSALQVALQCRNKPAVRLLRLHGAHLPDENAQNPVKQVRA